MLVFKMSRWAISGLTDSEGGSSRKAMTGGLEVVVIA
jgi:hypothetical protein